ncbi:MAG TPA: hypothetical protein VIS06_05045 [Mycobacteriales bacterium]
MKGTGSPRLPRRQSRWAARETLRRQIRHTTELARWQRIDDELATLVTTASTFAGYPAGRDRGEVRLILRPDERQFGRLPRATLVRLNRAVGRSVSGYARYSALAACELAALPPTPTRRRRIESHRVVESGPVTVTDQRVVFHGEVRDWEWPMDTLVDIRHSVTDPFTVIEVRDRTDLSGLACPRGQVSRLRFLLALAVAHHTGGVSELVGRLRSDRAEHQAARPDKPVDARPEQAPNLVAAVVGTLATVYLGRSGQPVRWRLAQCVAAVIATAGVVALLVPHPWPR